jgi:putative Holliday junction resolvase
VTGEGGDPADPGIGWIRGRRLGLDVGTARIGVATCDPDGILATPVETIRVTSGDPDWTAEIRRLGELVEEYDAIGVIVGLPTSLKGRDTASTAMARSFVDAFLTASPESRVEFVDERLTTVTAGAALHGAGRNTRQQRGVIDQAAAVVLLQAWIDSRRARR